MRKISPDQLPINADGSVFHLHLRPEQLADKVVMMGDPERVGTVAAYFDSIEFDRQSREFRTITGSYKGKRITALSHGIGCDNLDIVMNELDALVNIDLQAREVKPDFHPLTLVRIGTSGGLQPFAPIGSYVASEISMGMDGLLYFYEGGDALSDADLTETFVNHTNWNVFLATPYFVHSDKELLTRIGFDMIKGITISAGGFYGPQGRHVRLGLESPEQNELLESFEYQGLKICNYEMESAALAGLANLMGHKAMTACLIIAGRYSGQMNTDYKASFENLITAVLDRI
ncbi:MAG: Uridine phosphorylase [Candidatus Ordinivivax streblomastigis]|uniref:Uridine phosphorylase n=1 Tax=Candidatus Ordinivivax streblomastigis TaxID=2540710 RepID=A0A5M8P0R4_9BACT|nr:MAG: Uridine phosphorylase [Candidatus Ordinivivax streblomastigis]